jgi:hypothetical protein
MKNHRVVGSSRRKETYKTNTSSKIERQACHAVNNKKSNHDNAIQMNILLEKELKDSSSIAPAQRDNEKGRSSLRRE